MPICMEVKANYVTRQGMWSNHLLGTLTNRKIAKYQKDGYYQNNELFRKVEKVIKVRKNKTAKLFAKFNL